MNATTRRELENDIIFDLAVGVSSLLCLGDDDTITTECKFSDGDIQVNCEAYYDYWEEPVEEPTGRIVYNRQLRYKDSTIRVYENGQDVADQLDLERINDELWESANALCEP